MTPTTGREPVPPHPGLDVYRHVIATIDEGFCIAEVLFDPEGTPLDFRYLDANAAFDRLTGLGHPVGKTMRELVPDLEPHWLWMFGRVATSGEPERFEHYAGALHDRWFRGHAFRIGDPACHTVAVLFEDVSARKRAEREVRESRERLTRELARAKRLHEISTALVREDRPDNLYGMVVEAAVDLMESDAGSLQMLEADENVLHLLAWRGFHPRSAEHWQRVRADSGTTCGVALGTGDRVTRSDLLNDPALSEQEKEEYRRCGLASCQSTPLYTRSGRLLGMVSTHWSRPHEPDPADVRLLDVLARLAADLLERAFTEKALLEKDRAKDEFLAVLAHELRNPLAPLRNMLRLLAREDVEPALRSKARDTMSRQVTHLVRLVDDLLEVSRVTRGELHLRYERVDLVGLVRSAADDFRPRVDEKGQEFQLVAPDEPVMMDADPVRVMQIVDNLLNNASKYSGRGGHIRLTVAREADEAVIRIRDDGIGIDRSRLPRVFEMFWRLDDAPEHGGLGIGLALVRKLAELHGGRIEAHSEGAGRGSEFTVRLPASPVADFSGPVSDEPLPSRSPRRVLIVDDNRDAAESLGLLLELNGHDVHLAFGGGEAIEATERLAPDVVLLDLGLPDVDGYEVARRIRARNGRKAPLLVAVTGWSSDEDRRRTAEAGFDAHLAKPQDIDDIERVISGGT